jgi:DNA-binding response OmpR family regulator
VLLVEDEASVVTGVRRALRAEGYDVDAAVDGVRGLDLALTGGYDVIILDVLLPGMNGYRVCQQAREQGLKTPIVMLSAKSGEWDIADGLDVGADDYLTKPFSTVELVARVRARARGDGGAAAQFVTGDLRLDPDLHRCWRGSDKIELTGRETRLLVALFEHLGSGLSRRELLACAWDDTDAAHANAVEVYVGRLRRKLDEPFGTNDIETIRGVGYRLRDHSATS